MPIYQYQVTGTPKLFMTMPDLTQIASYPLQYATDQNVTAAQVTAYYMALQGALITVNVTTTSTIPDAIRDEVRKILFPGTPVLPNGNPILDVVVNPSEPSGGNDIWRSSDDFYIHPLSNMLTTQGRNYVTIAPRNVSGDPYHAFSAHVLAERQFL